MLRLGTWNAFQRSNAYGTMLKASCLRREALSESRTKENIALVSGRSSPSLETLSLVWLVCSWPSGRISACVCRLSSWKFHGMSLALYRSFSAATFLFESEIYRVQKLRIRVFERHSNHSIEWTRTLTKARLTQANNFWSNLLVSVCDLFIG